MILAFSTSSPWASVALISPSGEVQWERQEEAPRRASGACLRMLEEMQLRFPLDSVSLFAADVGPGSFTGVRVGVILAKTFGFAYDKPVVGATSFDLISPTQPVALPSKKGEYFLRVPDQDLVLTCTLDPSALGYGEAFASPQAPHAHGFANLMHTLRPTTAERFIPEYLLPPSISQPKKPYRS